MIIRERSSTTLQAELKKAGAKNAASHVCELKLDAEIQILRRQKAMLQQQIFLTKRLIERVANDHQMLNVL